MSVLTLVLCSCVGLVAYTYIGYPALLMLVGAFRPRRKPAAPPAQWPMISIVVPAYNEEAQIRGLLDSLLALDYPADRRQIVVVSDASTDATDRIVAEYADRGIELLRMPKRVGKTAAENYARRVLRGEIVINTDASTRIDPAAVRALVAEFADPSVGVASGRDVSVARSDETLNVGESGYVGYEMWVRDLETRVSGIVGASGCLYAIRADLHRHLLPEALSRDFAAPLVAREAGRRSISVPGALCAVPRTSSLRREYRRKVRTFTRGMETLFFKRHLLNPFRHGVFAWMLWSHKVCRWLVPWAGVAAFVCILLLGLEHAWARWLLLPIAAASALALVGWRWPEGRPAPRLLTIPAYFAAANIAVIEAWFRAVRGELNPIWEPTRREALEGQAR